MSEAEQHPFQQVSRRQLFGLAAASFLAAQRTLGGAQPDAPVLPNEMGPKYADWSWPRWKFITNAKPPEIKSEQAGREELVELLQTRGKPIQTVASWERKRKEIRHLILRIVGEPPRRKVSLQPRILEETELDDHVRRKISYFVEPGEEVQAYLLIPKKLSGRAPAFVCPHSTDFDGKLQQAGLTPRKSAVFGLDLVKRGYVTLAADAICFGERHEMRRGHYGEAIDFYRKHPNWSILGKMIWDQARSIDYLQSLDFVDPGRIGSIGLSHGAYTTIFSAAFDERVKVSVEACGFNTFRSDGNPYRWSHATALMPRLGFFLAPKVNIKNYLQTLTDRPKEIPFDFHHVLSLIAPRSFYVVCALDDGTFPRTESVRDVVVPMVRKVYGLYGAEDRLETHFFKGGHSFPSSAAERVYPWIDRWMNRA